MSLFLDFLPKAENCGIIKYGRCGSLGELSTFSVFCLYDNRQLWSVSLSITRDLRKIDLFITWTNGIQVRQVHPLQRTRPSYKQDRRSCDVINNNRHFFNYLLLEARVSSETFLGPIAPSPNHCSPAENPSRKRFPKEVPKKRTQRNCSYTLPLLTSQYVEGFFFHFRSSYSVSKKEPSCNICIHICHRWCTTSTEGVDQVRCSNAEWFDRILKSRFYRIHDAQWCAKGS